jgi:hypothetical protein
MSAHPAHGQLSQNITQVLFSASHSMDALHIDNPGWLPASLTPLLAPPPHQVGLLTEEFCQRRP